MELETINSAPSFDDFTPLSEHQSQTPGTFFGGNPVLHLYCPNSRVVLQDASSVESLGPLLGAPEAATRRAEASSNSVPNGEETETETNGERAQPPRQDVTLSPISVFVSSDFLIIYSPSKSKGVKLPYPSIALHAISTLSLEEPDSEPTKALYMQLNLYDTAISNSEDDIRTAEVAILPFPSSSATSTLPEPGLEQAPEGHASTASTNTTPEEATKMLFEAVSACQDLHPDPHENEDEEPAFAGGIGTVGVPGDGGWITSENMAQFMDSNGNFVGFGDGGDGANEGAGVTVLGPGAGTVRQREEGDKDEDGEGGEGEDAAAEDADEVEGAVRGETKWQRTG